MPRLSHHPLAADASDPPATHVRALSRPRGAAHRGASAKMLAGALVLMFPMLSGVDWRAPYLSIPDLALVVTAVGVLLVALGVAHGRRILRARHRGGPAVLPGIALSGDRLTNPSTQEMR